MIEEKITPIYAGKIENFNWMGFGSGKGTNLEECAKVKKPVLLFSDRKDPELFSKKIFSGIEKISMPAFEFLGSRKTAEQDNKLQEYLNKCVIYNHNVANRIKGYIMAKHLTVDLIILGGYMRILTDPFTRIYKDKIINVHPGDLSILNENDERIYVGDKAVLNAVENNADATRSSVIIVNDGVDDGEILTQGPEVRNNKKEYLTMGFETYANMHQALQKEISDWPAITSALKLIMEGKLAIGDNINHFNRWRTVYLKDDSGEWQPLSYSGFEIKA